MYVHEKSNNVFYGGKFDNFYQIYEFPKVDIHDEYEDQEEEEIREILPEREYIVLGSTRLDDLDEVLHIDIASQDYDSIGGYIIEQLDRFPEEGESVTTESGIRLVVDKADRTRIEKVHIYLPPREKEEAE